jgi:hypothetical protein
MGSPLNNNVPEGLSVQWWSFEGLSQQGVDFSKKSLKEKYLLDLTSTDVHNDHQKLGTILENKVVQKLKFSKNDDNNKSSPKMMFVCFVCFFVSRVRTFHFLL